MRKRCIVDLYCGGSSEFTDYLCTFSKLTVYSSESEFVYLKIQYEIICTYRKFRKQKVKREEKHFIL